MSKKVLVADDSVVIQKSIGITFAQEDLEVAFVGNGDEAYQRAKEFGPDLILADTSMPNLSGPDLCRKLREETDFKHTPILLLSSTQESFSDDDLRSIGANDFIQKPFESSQLLSKIQPLLDTPPPAPEPEPISTPEPAPAAYVEQTVVDRDPEPEPVAPPQTTVTAEPSGEPIASSGNVSSVFENSFSEADTSEIPTNTEQAIPLEPPTAEFDASQLSAADSNPSPVDVEESPQVPPSPEVSSETEDFSALPPSEEHFPAGTLDASPQPTPELTLSDEQIETIVKKVFENVIERIAWEVVPEVAERLIKEELAKITEDK